MEEFEINVNGLVYKVVLTNFKDGFYIIKFEGDVYTNIQMDENEQWVQVDPETGLPVTKEYVSHLNEIGIQIESYYGEQCAEE